MFVVWAQRCGLKKKWFTNPETCSDKHNHYKVRPSRLFPEGLGYKVLIIFQADNTIHWAALAQLFVMNVTYILREDCKIRNRALPSTSRFSPMFHVIAQFSQPTISCDILTMRMKCSCGAVQWLFLWKAPLRNLVNIVLFYNILIHTFQSWTK